MQNINKIEFFHYEKLIRSSRVLERRRIQLLKGHIFEHYSQRGLAQWHWGGSFPGSYCFLLGADLDAIVVTMMSDLVRRMESLVRSSTKSLSNEAACVPLLMRLQHRWELPGNYHYFEKIWYFTPLFGELSIILVTPNFTNILYTYPLRYIIYLGEPSGNIISN